MEAAILERVIRLWSSSEVQAEGAAPREGAASASASASASAAASHGSARVAAVWGQMVSGAFEAVEGSRLLTTKAEFRRRLVDEVMASPAAHPNPNPNPNPNPKGDGFAGRGDASQAEALRAARAAARLHRTRRPLLATARGPPESGEMVRVRVRARVS